MKLLADLHTHSNYSRFGHGKSTIEEIAFRANELGLKEVAITDHGFKHFFRTSKAKLAEARKIIDEINTWSQTKVLLGVEADIINENGDLDIDEETLDMIDILIAGYHKMIKTDFAGFFGNQKNTKKAIQKATNAYINAVNRYPIHFITHLDSVLTTNLYEVGCACKDNGVMIEINNRHLNWTSEQLDELVASTCNFVVSSDAHISDDVGRVEDCFKFIKKHKIPAIYIANVEFEDFELTSRDREDKFYMNLHKQLNKEDDEIKEIIAATEPKIPETKIETTKEIPKLSKEMEEALAKIALEQGISDYQREDGEEMPLNEEDDNDSYFKTKNHYNDDTQDDLFVETSNDLYQDNVANYNQTEKKSSFMSHIERTYDAKAPNSSKYYEENEEINEVDEVESITNTLNQFKNGSNRQYRDNSYQNNNNQEQQIEMIKSYNNTPKNVHGEEINQNNNILFDSNMDYQNYNVNSDVEQRKSREVVEINYNTPKKVNNQPSKNVNSNYEQQNRGVTRNSNGLIDFSSLTDDEE